MINFDRFTLNNGLKVLVHRDESTPIAVVNVLYDVGARDENPDRTGFAHLFEHLMFGGSVNIPVYDEPLQKAGGDNNAFTNNDITNYYLTLPKENLETAFWLESDRMLSLAFTEKSLEVQRNVVIEEFKQRYLNQPYGDAHLLLRPLAYKVHPYQWSTIGKETAHIADATLEEVKSFFYKHYAPNNAILSVTGNVTTGEVKKLAEKWFGPIEKRNIAPRNLPAEPAQTETRTRHVQRDVPFDAIYKAYHMCGRQDEAYHTCDLISDILSNGNSSRLYLRLVQQKKLFSELNAYISGSIDNGLFHFGGKLMKGISMQQAEDALNEEIDFLKIQPVDEYELDKVKNKVESTLVFSYTNTMEKAYSIAFFELLGNAGDINSEVDKYRRVTTANIQETAKEIFRKENCSTLYYEAK